MTENYDKSFFILINLLEGYESDLPFDVGGPTILGVSSRFYPKEYAELKSLPKDEALKRVKDFYYKEFWNKYMCDNLPDKIDTLYFVTAVNTPRGEKIIAFNIGSFENECLELIDYYINQTKSEYKIGLVNRVLKVWKYLGGGHV